MYYIFYRYRYPYLTLPSPLVIHIIIALLEHDREQYLMVRSPSQVFDLQRPYNRIPAELSRQGPYTWMLWSRRFEADVLQEGIMIFKAEGPLTQASLTTAQMHCSPSSGRALHRLHDGC